MSEPIEQPEQPAEQPTGPSLHPAAWSVGHPIGTSVIFVVVIVLGIVGLLGLVIDLLPEIDAPRITVTTAYEGVAPQDIETLLTRPMEQAVSTIDGVERIESTSSEGLARVQMHFEWGVPLDEAVNDIRAQLDRARASFPDGAEAPTVLKFDLSGAAVAHLGLAGTGDARRLRFLAEDELARRLEAVPGVARVDVRGGRVREIRVELQRDRIAALGIDVQAISTALARENHNVSAGNMIASGQEVVIRTEGEFRSPAEIGNVVVAQREGRAIQLRELAEIRDGIQEVRDELWIDGVPGIRLIISKQSGANTIEVVRALREEVAQINQEYAGRLELSMLRDSGEFIEDAIGSVLDALLIGGALAVLVLLAFLRDVRATMVVSTAIPISVLATLALMYFMDITLNLMSFGGLALGIGMLVDNAIVVLENIYRKREAGLEPDRAAIEGCKEVTGPVIAGTLTTLAVFVPVVFLGGFAGVFFREMAVVVCFSLLCSLIVALTLVPMIASRLLRGEARANFGGGGPSRPLFERGYRSVLARVLRRPGTVIGVAALLFVATGSLVPRLGTELMPEADEGRLKVSVQLPVGTPVTETAASIRELSKVVADTLAPGELEHMVVIAGPENWWRPAGGNEGQIDLMLVDASEREHSQDEIIAQLSEALAGVPGADIRVTADTDNVLLRVMRGGADDRLSVDITGHDLVLAEQLGEEVEARASTVAGIRHARPSRELGQLERALIVDRTRLAELGIGSAEVASAVEHYVLGRVSTRLRDDGDEFDIRVVLRKEDRERLEQLDSLPVALPTSASSGAVEGGPRIVALGQLARIEERVGPSSITREDQQRILKIGLGVGERDLGSVVADLEQELDQIAVPEGFTLRVGGEYLEQEKMFSRLLLGGVLALFLVYAVMAIQFESLRGPLVVMTAVPFALTGVILALLLSDTTLNMNSALGVIVLIGIVVNNAIVLIDHIAQLEREGHPRAEAIREGASHRLRPVLMTTLTTLLGMAPLAFGFGEGNELQAPLARAVVGGLSLSTLVTLLIVPAILQRSRRATHGDGGSPGDSQNETPIGAAGP
jgi:HAE1 family hydrophobic/amphiphilic exporter-1